MICNTETDIDEKMRQFEKIHDKLKFKAFGKIRISGKTHKKEKSNNTKNNVGDLINAKSIFEEKEQIASQEIEEIKKKKLSKVGNIWEIRKKVIGGKKKDSS